jgi:hypothetical protein
MARHEQDREDLMAEATALVERMELRVSPQPEADASGSPAEPIVLGVRRDGCLSIYFSADFAVHFNTRQEVRRTYLNGALIKAERGKLVSMRRERSEQAVELMAREMSEEEQQTLLADVARRVAAILASLQRNDCQSLRQVPADLPALDRAREWLAMLPIELVVAASPRVG